jgi:hypothetical protein
MTTCWRRLRGREAQELAGKLVAVAFAITLALPLVEQFY